MRARLVLAAIVAAGAAAFDAPVANAACSVFSRVPCSPFVCSIYGGGFCISPVGQGVRLTIESTAAAGDQPATGEAKDGKTADRDATDRELDTIRAMYDALRGCWVPPGKDEARPGTQMSVRFALKRSGEIIAAPRVNYVSPGIPSETRQAYLDAITAALARCTPLHFSAGMAGAIAGQPIAVRFVDNREQP
jgi:hypothetical protein